MSFAQYGQKKPATSQGSYLWPPVLCVHGPMIPNASHVAAASPNVHIMPANGHSPPLGRARNLKCHLSAVNGFSSYELCAVWAKKANSPPRGETCAHYFSACTARWIQILLQWLQRPLTDTYFPHMCIQSPWAGHHTSTAVRNAVQRFSFYQLCAVWAKKANNPPKGPTCAFQFSACPAPMDPIPSPVAAASANMHIMPAYAHSVPLSTPRILKCHQLAVQRFSCYHLCGAWAKKANNPPKGPTCAFQFSASLAPMDPIPSPMTAAPPTVYIRPAHVHSLPVGRARHLKCNQLAVQGFSFYQSKKPTNPLRIQLVATRSLRARPQWTQMLLQWVWCPLTYTYCPHMCFHSPWSGHGSSNAINQGFSSYPLCAVWAKNPPKGPTCGRQFSACTAMIDRNACPVPAASPNVHTLPAHVHSLPVGRALHLKCRPSAVQGFSFY